jgi:hypothetical protein
MLRFARRAAFVGFQMAVFGLAMARFAIGTAYQMASERRNASERDDSD